MIGLLRKLWLAPRAVLERLMGRGRLDRLLDAAGFFRLKERLLRSERSIPGGPSIVFRPDDEKILREIYEEGCYSCAPISDGDTVVDVGAHIGCYALYAAARTPAGKVVAVEPASWNLPLLHENVRRNRAGNVHIREFALADKEGELDLHFTGDHAIGSIIAPERSALSKKVPVRTLDSLFESEGIGTCAVLKIDVEGAELHVLQGGRSALGRTRQIVMELHRIGDLPERVLALLRGSGFDCRIVAREQGTVTAHARRG